MLCGISDIFPRQTIWDLYKTFCRWEWKLSFSKYTKSEIIQIYAIFTEFMIDLHQILPILGFTCYGTSTGCSAGSQIFFLDKQSETCWKLSADENRSCPSQNIQNRKSSNLCYIFDVYGRFYLKYCQLLGFTYYGTSTRCSAGSHIFFLDKQSETC